MNVNRHFYRCADCLAVFAVDNPKGESILCACGGRCSWMGQVRAGSIVQIKHKCACDARCTHAVGPSCDCSCGGANHGTGKTVEVIREVGKVASAKNQPDLKVRDEWLAERKRAGDLLHLERSKIQLRLTGHMNVYEIQLMEDWYLKASLAKSHKNRMRLLAKIKA